MVKMVKAGCYLRVVLVNFVESDERNAKHSSNFDTRTIPNTPNREQRNAMLLDFSVKARMWLLSVLTLKARNGRMAEKRL